VGWRGDAAAILSVRAERQRPAEDSTTVLVWYSPTAIYFGIRAYQDSASVRATLADRDKITGDDYVEILLDTFDDHRQALVFGVNPLGVQADGTLLDAPRQIATTLSAVSTGAYTLDLSPDYVYESKGHPTAWGYEVEVRIPFKTLRYQARDPQDWASTSSASCRRPATSTPGRGCSRRAPPSSRRAGRSPVSPGSGAAWCSTSLPRPRAP